MISKITERIRQNEKWINLAYYLIYAALFFSALVGTTEFMQWSFVTNVRNLVYMGSTAGMLLLCVLGLALQSDRRINVAKILILAIGILQFLFGGGSSLILILTILIGATDRKSACVILRESFIIGLSILFITYLAVANGYIMDNMWGNGRHSFGFIYYSHFSDKLLYLYMIYRCLRRKRESMIGYALILAIVYFDYKYTHARTVTICFLVFILFCVIYDVRGRKCCDDYMNTMKDNFVYSIGTFASGAYIWAMAITFIGVFAYRYSVSLDGMNIPVYLHTFIDRLIFNSRALEEYGVTFFGQKVYEVTNTLAGEIVISDAFYMDNTFMRLFVITGIVTLLFFVAYMTLFMLKVYKEKRFYLFAALLVAALGGLSETYTMNFYYNVFLILAFSYLGDVGK